MNCDQPNAREIHPKALIGTPGQIAEIINDQNGLLLSDEELVSLATACNQRIASRLQNLKKDKRKRKHIAKVD